MCNVFARVRIRKSRETYKESHVLAAMPVAERYTLHAANLARLTAQPALQPGDTKLREGGPKVRIVHNGFEPWR